MTTRDDVVTSARSYVGVRRRHQGRDRSGLDCIGLLMAVAKDIGYREIENPTDYMRTIDPMRFMTKLHEYTDPGLRSRIRNGSIGLFKQAMAPIHCGLFVFEGSDLMLIHAEINKRAIVEEPALTWLRDLVEVREYRGVR